VLDYSSSHLPLHFPLHLDLPLTFLPFGDQVNIRLGHLLPPISHVHTTAMCFFFQSFQNSLSYILSLITTFFNFNILDDLAALLQNPIIAFSLTCNPLTNFHNRSLKCFQHCAEYLFLCI